MYWVQDSLLLQPPLPASELAAAQAGVPCTGSCCSTVQQLKHQLELPNSVVDAALHERLVHLPGCSVVYPGSSVAEQAMVTTAYIGS